MPSSSEAGDLTPTIDGFVDLELIGHGGFSSVYRARDEILDRDVALKVLSFGDRDRDRFQRECRILASLSETEGVVPVLAAAVTDDGRPVIVMKFMAGGSLGEQVRSNGPMSVQDALSMGSVLASALGEAHNFGIFHRDIKPDNVLFSSNGSPALADFGIAVVEQAIHSTNTMESLSPPFSSPERFQADSENNDIRGDIYALGATLYYAIKGSPPFGTAKEGGVVGLLGRITRDPLPALDAPGATHRLNQVLATAMSKSPDDRYQSAEEFSEALQACAHGEPQADGSVLVEVRGGEEPLLSGLTEPVESEAASGNEAGSVGMSQMAPYWAVDVKGDEPTVTGPGNEASKEPRVVSSLADDLLDELSPPLQRPEGGNGKKLGLVAVGLVVVAIMALSGVLVATNRKSAGDTKANRNNVSTSGGKQSADRNKENHQSLSDAKGNRNDVSETAQRVIPTDCTFSGTANLVPGVNTESVGAQTLGLNDDASLSCQMSDSTSAGGKLHFMVEFPELNSHEGVVTGQCSFEWFVMEASEGQCTVTLKFPIIYFSLTVTKGSFVGRTASADIEGWTPSLDQSTGLITGLTFNSVQIKWS